MWGKPGKDTATLGAFFDGLPEGAAESIEAVSMDMGPAYAKAVRERVPDAVICFDQFHLVKLATDALEALRRQVWQAARKLPDKRIAKAFKGARWALQKNPGDLTDAQAETLKRMKRDGGILWRAYQLKEALREVFAGDLDPATVGQLLDRWCSRAQRCRIPEFARPPARSAPTAPASTPPSNAAYPTAATKASTTRSASHPPHGFHSAEAALALVQLACGPVTLELPYHTGQWPCVTKEFISK